MLVISAVLALIAAALHVYIFVLEAFWWTTPRGRAVFGTNADQAAQTRDLAFNQGFYNLFLAVMSGVGAALLLIGHITVGATLVVAGCGSMVLAGLVLVGYDRTKARPAIVQLSTPLLALIALAAHGL